MFKVETKIAPVRTAEDQRLWDMGLATIKELETEDGILASGRKEIFGCIFGRDSLITGLKLLRAYEKTGNLYFLQVVRKSLKTLAELQGRETNLESGEEPGKIIHEYRERDHDHLTKRGVRPWFVYSDGKMRNYDSVDSTPLFLIAVSRYFELSHDEEFLAEMMPHVESALNWLLTNLDRHNLGFVSYDFPEERQCGGLAVQSWMDSHDSVFHEDGSDVLYPIAPAEVQHYSHVALRRWSRFFKDRSPSVNLRLERRASELKQSFNKHFVRLSTDGVEIAFAIDGGGKVMSSSRSSMGHVLWFGLDRSFVDGNDSILEPVYVGRLVRRLMAKDLFASGAGLRTLSNRSVKFDPRSYHNGSVWPHDTAIVAESFELFGYEDEAETLRRSLKQAWNLFGTPVELFVSLPEGSCEYVSEHGQKACSEQAWSAASILTEV